MDNEPSLVVVDRLSGEERVNRFTPTHQEKDVTVREILLKLGEEPRREDKPIDLVQDCQKG